MAFLEDTYEIDDELLLQMNDFAPETPPIVYGQSGAIRPLHWHCHQSTTLGNVETAGLAAGADVGLRNCVEASCLARSHPPFPL